MLKFIGFAVITAATTLAGNYFSLLLKSRLTALKKMNYMIDEISAVLRFKSATVYEIVSELREDGRFSDFEFLKNISADVPFQKSWRDAAESCPPRGMSKSDTELLCEVGARLGTSDAESQINTLELQRTELMSVIADAESDCNKKAKLYRSMGVLAGAFISIMLI